MRAYTYLLTLSVVLYATGTQGKNGVPPPAGPDCNGTKVQQGKCADGKVPTNYYEAAVCQGELPDLGTCKHSIAFRIDNFYCTAPALDPDRKTYTTYCTKSLNTEVCTIRQECTGTTIVKDGKSITKCEPKEGGPTYTSDLLTYERSYKYPLNPDAHCKEYTPLP